MRFYCLLLFVTLTSCLAYGFTAKIRNFEDFKRTFNKQYENSQIEALRKSHFEASLQRLEKIRHEHPTVELDVNEYSDLVISPLSLIYFINFFLLPSLQKSSTVCFRYIN